MSNTSDIWLAFGRTFSILFLVLALLILIFYLIKRFSESKGAGGRKDYIKILSVHHLSPKEKLILVTVAGENLLVGVTPNNISKIAKIENEINLPDADQKQSASFSDFLARKISGSIKPDPVRPEKEQSR